MSTFPDAVASSARRRVLRGLVVSGAVVAGTVLSAALPAVASAGTAPGTTVIGRLMQAWPESSTEFAAGAPGHDGADGPLSWVQGAGGQAVRIPTAVVEGVTPGSTVQVTVGAPVTDPAATDGTFPPALGVVDTTVVVPAKDAAVDPSRRFTN